MGGRPAAFAGAPIYNEKGDMIGVMAAQISFDEINNLMSERTGLGETGETYLVGPDKLLRSDTFRDPENHNVRSSFTGSVENNGVDTDAVRSALAGISEGDIGRNYRNDLVVSAFTPLVLNGLNWVLIAEMDVQEALIPRTRDSDKDCLVQFKERYGYHDLLLLDEAGNCFYSVNKEDD